MTISADHLGRVGRLGNQLWELASTVGLADTAGEPCQFDPGWPYRRWFSVPDEMFGREPARSVLELIPHVDERVRVYLQDYGYFAHIAPRIRGYFQPSPEAWDVLTEAGRSVGLPRRQSIGVHVRRGDNVYDPAVPDKHLYYPLPTTDYYRRALAELPDWPIVVFSDDPEWCEMTFRKEIAPYNFVVYHGITRPKEHEPGYDEPPMDWVDLHLMGRTSAVVGSNSSYGWWGSFLTGYPGIFPAAWYGPKLAYVNADLMFPPDWRRL